MARRARVAAALSLAAAGAAAAGKRASFAALGAGTRVTGMSPDGAAVAGVSDAGVFLWTAANGTVALTGGAADGNPRPINSGAVVGSVGSGDVMADQAAVWRGGSWKAIGAAGSSGWGISDDGATVVGMTYVTAGRARATVWGPNGTSALPAASSCTRCSSRANAVSGATVAGWQDLDDGTRQGCVWRGGVQHALTDGSGQPVGEALFVASEGAVVTGLGDQANHSSGAWVLQGGALRDLGVLRAGDRTAQALSASADGSIVVGDSGPPGDRVAFVWTAAAGMIALRDHIASVNSGAVPEGWVLGTAAAVSTDGSVIAGWGFNPDGQVEGWRVAMG